MAGCALHPSSTSRPPVSSPDLLTWEDIESVAAADAYDIVQILRPSWLRARPARQSNLVPGESVVMVMLNESLYGDASSLRSISRDMVGSIEYLGGGAAQREFTSQSGRKVVGVIKVSSVRLSRSDLQRPDPRAREAIDRDDRVAVTLLVGQVGRKSGGVARPMAASMIEAGWSSASDVEYPQVRQETSSGLLDASFVLRRPWVVDVLGGYAPQSSASGFRQGDRRVIRLSHGAWFGGVAGMYEWKYLRGGVGPVLLRSDWLWDSERHGAYPSEPRRWTSTTAGVVATGGVDIPVTRHLVGSVHWHRRWHASQRVEGYEGFPDVTLPVNGTFLGLGVGVRY